MFKQETKIKTQRDKLEASMQGFKLEIEALGSKHVALSAIDDEKAVQSMIEAKEHVPCKQVRQCELDMASLRHKVKIAALGIENLDKELSKATHARLLKQQAIHGKDAARLIKLYDKAVNDLNSALIGIMDLKVRSHSTGREVRLNAGTRDGQAVEGEHFDNKSTLVRIGCTDKGFITDSEGRLIISPDGNPTVDGRTYHGKA